MFRFFWHLFRLLVNDICNTCFMCCSFGQQFHTYKFRSSFSVCICSCVCKGKVISGIYNTLRVLNRVCKEKLFSIWCVAPMLWRNFKTISIKTFWKGSSSYWEIHKLVFLLCFRQPYKAWTRVASLK